MNQIKDAKIEIKSKMIIISKEDATLHISTESQFWKKEENRKIMYEIYPELKKILHI